LSFQNTLTGIALRIPSMICCDARSASSACLRAVMSSMAAIVRVGRPAASRMTVMFTFTQATVPPCADSVSPFDNRATRPYDLREFLPIILPVFRVRDFRDSHLEHLGGGVAGDGAHLLVHPQPLPRARVGLARPPRPVRTWREIAPRSCAAPPPSVALGDFLL